jgi:hypothetical protein
VSDDEIVVERNEDDIEQVVPQQSGENAMWYSRCLEYLRLGPARSIRAVYNREKGNEHSKSVPASWSEAAKRFEWPRRAESYDGYLRSQVFKAGNASDTERVKKLDALINAMHDRLIAGLGEVEVNEKFVERYLAVMDLMARHTGGYAQQRHEVTGKDGKAIEVEGGITQQVIFYMPEIDELPAIVDASDNGEVAPVENTVEREESSDAQ